MLILVLAPLAFFQPISALVSIACRDRQYFGHVATNTVDGDSLSHQPIYCLFQVALPDFNIAYSVVSRNERNALKAPIFINFYPTYVYYFVDHVSQQ